jgi:hypothetical protein
MSFAPKQAQSLKRAYSKDSIARVSANSSGGFRLNLSEDQAHELAKRMSEVEKEISGRKTSLNEQVNESISVSLGPDFTE